MKKSKWGILFVSPYIVVYLIFTALPIGISLYKSLFVNYWKGLEEVGPFFSGLKNYSMLLSDGHLYTYMSNTAIMWILGFVPQLLLSVTLAAWFSDHRLGLKGIRFFKTVIYFPNLIIAASFASLFFSFLSNSGPVNTFLVDIGIFDKPFCFFSETWSTRSIVAFMNCTMWFGNTTLLLLAGMLGIDASLREAAEVDGANAWQIFTKITLPLIRPILLYVMITSLIGGIQMFDVPHILTRGTGDPNRSTMTLLMYLNKHMFSKNYGVSGALSIILFLVTAALSLIVFSVNAGTKKREAIQ
uniref:carbohydrate ABC transporter permease n=1 Tax=Eubacterium cellulosolvens TaxID=29322 RepID=UPI000482FC84|nr:sugar ABC transporter permease [[Eubacterium] cellulosolvens]